MRHRHPIFGGLAAAMSAFVLLPQQGLAHDDRGSHSHLIMGRITVEEAWSPTSPPTIGVRAVYFELINGSDAPIVVVGAESREFGDVAIHDTTIADGLTRMGPVEQLAVPAVQSASFRPHGLHLMLTNPTRHHNEGDLVPINLLFADGTSLTFSAQVRKAEGHHPHDHGCHEAAEPRS